MKKLFKILSLLLVMSFPIVASATEIKVDKKITTYESWESQNGGQIVLTISGITVDETATYKFQLINGSISTNWYDATSVSSTNIVVTLDKSKTDILSILSKSNEAYLNVKKIKDGVDTDVLSSHKIDISIPLSRTYKVGHFTSGYHGIKALYDVDKIYYQYKKVDNPELIKKYLEYLKGYNDKSNIYWGYYVDDLIEELNIKNEIPETGWNELTGTQTTTQPKEEGLYYLWIKAPASSKNKELIGCVFSKRFSDIKVVEKQLQDLVVEEDDEQEETPIVEEQPKENVEEVVTNPPTGLHISLGVIGILLISIFGVIVLRKKNYFSKI